MNRNLSCLAAVAVVLFAVPAFAAEGTAQPPLTLRAGQNLVLDVADISKIAVGDPGVADIKPIGENSLLVVGVKEGKTSIRVWKSNKEVLTWEVTVTRADAKSAPTPGAEIVSLKVGAKTSKSAPNLSRVAVGDPAIADVKPTDAGIDIQGKAPGSTTIVLWVEGGSRKVIEVQVSP
ncbi:MAG: pilus assembly protein N-terminal domain-containing protein [Deltaproteobacteria bacterium]|nr:pilus assembly protein N-terminal domain-containing protein [Deltaproteobacteria bacterium]